MTIAFGCTCGKTLRVDREHAGKRVKCPACQAPLQVPADSLSAPVVEPPPQPAEDSGYRIVGDEPSLSSQSRVNEEEEWRRRKLARKQRNKSSGSTHLLLIGCGVLTAIFGLAMVYPAMFGKPRGSICSAIVGIAITITGIAWTYKSILEAYSNSRED